MLARAGAKVGDVVTNGEQGEIKAGNRKQLKDIPDGYTVHCLEVTPFTK